MTDPMITDLIRQINRLQQQVDSLKKPEVGRWVDWTPTVYQSGNVAVTVDYARVFYDKGKVTLIMEVTVTGSGTAANPIYIQGLPYDSAHNGFAFCVGSFHVRDDSVPQNYAGSVDLRVVSSTTSLSLRVDQTGGNGLGQNPSVGLDVDDTIGLMVSYEAA